MANLNNIYSLQLLRNGQAYASRELAKQELERNAAGVTQDGVAVLARYLTGESPNKKIMTLIGFYAVASEMSATGAINTMTIVDVEGASEDVEELRQEINAKLGDGVTSANTATAQLQALSGNSSSTSAETSVAGAKKYTDGKLDELDYNLAKDDNKVVMSFEQTNGKISGTSDNLTNVKLGGYALDTTKTGAIAATDTVKDALSKLENNATAAKISNADGSINVTTATTGTDINVNIKSGEKVIKKDGNNGLYTDLDLVKITTGLPTTVKERYQLLASDDTQIGADIDIYKDSSLYSVYLGHVDDAITSSTNPTVIPGSGDTALCFIYLINDGTYTLVAVNVEEFIEENEFASGVTWDSAAKKVRGVVDSTSEKDSQATPQPFLTVGADGFKVSGIKDEIDRKINALDASLDDGTTAGTATQDHIKVSITEENGILTSLTVDETNIADKDKLEELSAKTFTVATSSNNSITTAVTDAADGTKSVDLITDASKIQMSGFTAAESGFTSITQSSSITEAFKAVEGHVIDNEEVVSAALNDLELRKANVTDLEEEIAARKAVDGQNGQTYVAHANKQYISAATSLDDADVKLNDAIASITSGWIDGVQVNGVDLPESANKVNILIEALNTAATSANSIVITQDNATGKLTFQLGTIDAGTYN